MFPFLFFVCFAVFGQSNDARISKSIEQKVMMMQQFVHKGDKAEEAFWQTKGKVTFQIVNYTEEQNPQFKQLFIDQFRELLPVYNKMLTSYDEKDTNQFIHILIRQEDDYRKLLTPEQLKKYTDKLTWFEQNDEKNRDAYNSLFFSDWLLNEYKKRF